MGHYDDAYALDAERERIRRQEHARFYGPALLAKVNTILNDSQVRDNNIEQKRNELRDAVILWMYREGAISEI